MGQRSFTRLQSTQTINAFSQKITFELGRGYILRELMLRLSGSFTYAAAANNIAGTLGRGDEWSLIERIDIVVNGSDVIRTFSGTQLRIMNLLCGYGLARPSLTLGDVGTTAAPTFDSTLVIPFWMPMSVRPIDTALVTNDYGSVRIDITVAASTGINSANGPTAVAATLDIASYESFGIKLEPSDFRIYTDQRAVGGANTDFAFDLPVNATYRGFLIGQANGFASTSADQNNLITNIKLSSGTQIFRDLPFNLLRDWQRQRQPQSTRELTQLTAGAQLLANANGPFLRSAKSANLDMDGWVFLDLCQDGYLTECLDAYGLSELKLRFNVSGAVSLTVIPWQIFPRRKAA